MSTINIVYQYIFYPNWQTVFDDHIIAILQIFACYLNFNINKSLKYK